MFDTLLQTKLHIPVPPAAVVARQRLLDQLTRGRRGKLSLVMAPAGFGKTTLVTEWLAQQSVPVGWLSLEAADNDLGRFLRYFCAAVHNAAPKIGQRMLSMLHTAELPPLPILMTSLLNELHQQPFILVLDDYHLIEEPQIHEAVRFFLTHQEAGAHLVITSRSEPPLPLSRLRARRQLTEIVVADLRFGQAETAALLADSLGRELADREVAQLAERTEGWAAGLHLAALSLRHQSDVQRFINSFAGTNRYVLDYLLDEVFDQQPVEMQQFLLYTSLLERFSAPLCDEVLERHDSSEMIEKIGRNNLFLIPLDNQRQWFRYHHLFADLLQHRLREQSPIATVSLYRRASNWFATQKLTDEAIHYALLGGDYDDAAALIEENAIRNLMREGNPGLLNRQIETLPKEVFEAHPRLYMAQAWAVLLMGQLDEAQQLLEAVESSAVYQQDEVFRETIDLTLLNLRVILTRGRGEMEAALELAQEALQRLPKDNVHMRSILYLGIGSSYNVMGDLDAAARAASEVLELTDDIDTAFLRLHALTGWAEVHIRRLQFAQAEALYKEALELISKAQLDQTPMAALLYISLGEIAFNRNQLTEAEQYFKQALALAEPAGLVDGVFPAISSLARLRLHQQKYDEAQQLLERILPQLIPEQTPWLYEIVESRLIEIDLARGDLRRVCAWVAEQNFSVEQPSDRADIFAYLQWFGYELYTAVATADNAPLQVLLPFIDQLLDQATQKQLTLRVLLLNIYKGMVHKQLGEHAQAHTCIQYALGLAAPQNHQSFFLEHPQWMVPLLQEAKQAAVEPEFAEQLLAAWEKSGVVLSRGKNHATANETLPEPLTERELEVLALIAGGLSTREVAERLFLSPGTVKWHINNIYGKLGVNSRVNAINRAQTLKIIP